MRSVLAEYQGQLLENVTAKFKRFGTTGKGQLSVLLAEVKLGEIALAEHVWVPYTTEFKNLNINKNDWISMDAQVEFYDKRAGRDYSFSQISNLSIFQRGDGPKLDVHSVQYFTFQIQEEIKCWNKIKGDEITFYHDGNRQVQKDITIPVGDIVEIELDRIAASGVMEFAWKTASQERWNRRAYFNPVKNGQALLIYMQYRMILPREIYFVLKDFYFKMMYASAGIDLPYVNDVKEHYVKPEKFNHRYFINYDEQGNWISDEQLTARKEYVYKKLPEVLEQLSEEEILSLVNRVYETRKSVDFYFEKQSPYYGDRVYLQNKLGNIFRSSGKAVKSRFLTILVEMLAEKPDGFPKLPENGF